MANQSNQSGLYIATLRMAASEGAELKAAAHRAQCSLNAWCVETLLAAARRAEPPVWAEHDAAGRSHLSGPGTPSGREEAI